MTIAIAQLIIAQMNHDHGVAWTDSPQTREFLASYIETADARYLGSWRRWEAEILEIADGWDVKIGPHIACEMCRREFPMGKAVSCAAGDAVCPTCARDHMVWCRECKTTHHIDDVVAQRDAHGTLVIAEFPLNDVELPYRKGNNEVIDTVGICYVCASR